MNENISMSSASQGTWRKIASQACRSAPSPIECPACHAHAMSAEWNISDLFRCEATIDLKCLSCGISQVINATLPRELPACYPFERVALVLEMVARETEPIAARIRQHTSAMPAAAFAIHPLWSETKWSATTFQWHPTSEAPPIMGLVFDNAEAGLEIFREAERQMNHEDRFEEIRVSIIEDPVPGEEHRPGYSVHICADPEALAAHVTAADFVVDPSIVPFLGQWNRHYPIPGMPALLPRFKKEFARHKEFLLAPVTKRADGKIWCNPELGIIKSIVNFRCLSDITAPDDPDAAALVLPQLITPPV